MATKRKGGPSRTTAGSSRGASILIRMYRVGFGDCFLVTLDDRYHILVDCGVHNKGNVKVGNTSLIDLAFQDIKEVSGGKLDIVIATHAHQDHVSGYGKFAAEFRKFDRIGEVWMPWTDDPSDARARSWHVKKQKMLGLLSLQLRARADSEAMAAVENAGPNPAAMQALRDGFGKGKVRYLKAGAELDAPADIAGFTAKILGPSDDQDFLAKMDPPGSDHYLRMAAAKQSGAGTHPFAGWELAKTDLLPAWPQLKPDTIKLMADSLQFPARAVAFSLDKFLNNTSIVALFSWKGKHLFFPGDAQYGDWISWYRKSGSEVLSDISFYKVAHHGSWNATPRGAVELMPQGRFAAMMSTQNVPWASIPRPALEKALDARAGGALMRSDSLEVKDAPSGPKIGTLPKGFQSGNPAKSQYWIDYTIG